PLKERASASHRHYSAARSHASVTSDCAALILSPALVEHPAYVRAAIAPASSDSARPRRDPLAPHQVHDGVLARGVHASKRRSTSSLSIGRQTKPRVISKCKTFCD